MKKKILMIAMAVLLTLALCGCNTATFMKDGQRDKLVKEYGVPQAEMEIEYERNEQKVNVKITYNLLLSKTPVTVINFINLVESGYYANTVFDSRINSTTNAWIAGRYSFITAEGETEGKYYEMEGKDYSIIGEFVQNGYVLPKDAADEENEDITDGNAKFSMFSLAMYHESSSSSFDSASTAFFMTIDTQTRENYKNFAVFAEVASVTVTVDGEEICKDAASVPASIVEDFDNMTTTTTQKVVVDTDADGNDVTESHTLLRNVISIVNIKMSDGKDYSNLPDKYVIK